MAGGVQPSLLSPLARTAAPARSEGWTGRRVDRRRRSAAARGPPSAGLAGGGGGRTSGHGALGLCRLTVSRSAGGGHARLGAGGSLPGGGLLGNAGHPDRVEPSIMWLFSRNKLEMPTPEQALPGRSQPIVVPGRHTVLGSSLAPPYPEGRQVADFGLGCFWGAERVFWQT